MKKTIIVNNIKDQQEKIQLQRNELKRIESMISMKVEQNNKQQEELKIIEETIYNISDGK
jgi:hypothetical protein